MTKQVLLLWHKISSLEVGWALADGGSPYTLKTSITKKWLLANRVAAR